MHHASGLVPCIIIVSSMQVIQCITAKEWHHQTGHIQRLEHPFITAKHHNDHKFNLRSTHTHLQKDNLHSIRKRRMIKADNQLYLDTKFLQQPGHIISDILTKPKSVKLNPGEHAIDSFSSKKDMIYKENGVYSKQEKQNYAPYSLKTQFRIKKAINEIFHLRKRDLRNDVENENISTNAAFYSRLKSVRVTPATSSVSVTMPSVSRDGCFNFVSCIQPYISYVAGTVMFILVLYLIIVFGRCVCDDSF